MEVHLDAANNFVNAWEAWMSLPRELHAAECVFWIARPIIVKNRNSPGGAREQLYKMSSSNNNTTTLRLNPLECQRRVIEWARDHFDNFDVDYVPSKADFVRLHFVVRAPTNDDDGADNNSDNEEIDHDTDLAPIKLTVAAATTLRELGSAFSASQGDGKIDVYVTQPTQTQSSKLLQSFSMQAEALARQEYNPLVYLVAALLCMAVLCVALSKLHDRWHDNYANPFESLFHWAFGWAIGIGDFIRFVCFGGPSAASAHAATVEAAKSVIPAAAVGDVVAAVASAAAT